MPDQAADRKPVVITGMAAVSACGRGTEPLLDATAAGQPAFGEVKRFDASRYRSRTAAELPGCGPVLDELAAVVGQACDSAGLTPEERGSTPLLLATRADSTTGMLRGADKLRFGATSTASALATRAGLARAHRVYTSACVAATTAVADAAAMISRGSRLRAVVAAAFLVDEYHFALFDAGRALAKDGVVRPFSADRRGLLLGDAVAAVVLERADNALSRGALPLARLTGWARAGDAYHVTQPRPDGEGLARAIEAALARAVRDPEDIGYVNANGSGTWDGDAAEASALHRAFRGSIEHLPVSSSKSVHGHALEASGLLELVVTVLALRAGRLPVNAGLTAPDERCPLNLVDSPRMQTFEHALSLNFAFGGANTALIVSAA